jgi:DUF1680 family protein
VFWIKLNQRFHALYPEDERYTAEIERSLLNIGIANQASAVGVEGAGIRYFALLNGHKEIMTNYSSCCEGQGTRLHGSLPEYIFSLPAAPTPAPASATPVQAAAKGGGGLYVNLLMSASINLAHAASTAAAPTAAAAAPNASFTIRSAFPYPQSPASAPISITVSMPADAGAATTPASTLLSDFTLSIRIPAWVKSETVKVGLNGNSSVAVGKRGSYLHINRNWLDGDVVSVHGVEQQLKASHYTGLSQVTNSSRWGFEYGPTLLAAVLAHESSWNNSTDCIHLPAVNPADPNSWLEPVEGKPLHFRPTVSSGHASTVEFYPYFEVADQLMTVFPCFDPVHH